MHENVLHKAFFIVNEVFRVKISHKYKYENEMVVIL